MGLFWKRKGGSDFISLGLSTPYEPEPQVEQPVAPEPVEPPVEQARVVEPAKPVNVEAPVAAPAFQSQQATAAQRTVEEPVEDENFLARFRKAVSATRENIASRIEDVVKGKKQIDETTLEELEEALIGADIGVQTTMAIIEDVRRHS
jgi:fused signal recognition particle receptor